MPVITRSQAKNIQKITDDTPVNGATEERLKQPLFNNATEERLKRALETLKICKQRLAQYILKQRKKKV
jgi:hypothetical protein